MTQDQEELFVKALQIVFIDRGDEIKLSKDIVDMEDK